MNIIRILADSIFTSAMFYLVWSIFNNKSYEGISAKTQLLFVAAFFTRTVSLFFGILTFYDIAVKLLFVLVTLLTFLLIIKFDGTYDRKNDLFFAELLIIPPVVLSSFLGDSVTVGENLWSFSQFLEVLAMIPQIHMMMQTRRTTKNMVLYFSLLSMSKFLYCFNILYSFVVDHAHALDIVSSIAGILDIVVFLPSVFILWLFRVEIKNSNQNHL